MKKILFSGCLYVLLLFMIACNDNSKADTHKHDDGSTHAYHDTTKPVQQEFNVADTVIKDSASHSHKDGKKHSH